MSDLWPEDLEVDAVKVPAAILREQAAALAERTKNVLEGRVVADPGTDPADAVADQFTWNFQIFAPALNYAYDLFSINHDIEMYPLIVETEDDELLQEYEEDISISDEAELLKLLRRLFSTVRTRRIVRALLAQSAEQKLKEAREAEQKAKEAAAAAALAPAPSAESARSPVPSAESAKSPTPSAESAESPTPVRDEEAPSSESGERVADAE